MGQSNMMDHDVKWLKAKCDSPGKSILEIKLDSGKEVCFFSHSVFLDLFFGDRSIKGPRVRRHVLTCNLGLSDEEARNLFASLKKMLKSNEAVYLQGVVDGEAVDGLLKSGFVAGKFFVLKRGESYCRRLIKLGCDFEGYLGSLSATRRKDLKKSMKRFDSEFLGRYELKCYRSEAEIRELFAAVGPVSALTYQAKNLGLGLSSGSSVEREFIAGAQLGYARCYILWLDGRPIAWRLGYYYHGTYYSHHVGFDPGMRGYHPGVIVHFLVIDDVTSNLKGAANIDLLYGDNDVKRKVSNDSRIESNYYLFPVAPRAFFTYLLISSFDRCIAILSGFAKRMGVKEKVRSMLR